MTTKPMDPESHCLVSGALAAVLRLSRIASIAPLHFVKESNGWRVSISSGWRVYGFIINITFNVLTIISFARDLYLGHEQIPRLRSFINSVVLSTDQTLTTVLSALVIYQASSLLRSMIACLNRVQQINSELNVIHLPPNEWQKTCFLIFWITTIVVLIIVEYLVDVFTTKTWQSFFYIFYFYSYVVVQLNNVQFALIVLHVKRSFAVVNDNIRNLRENVLMGSKISHRLTFRKLVRSYISLCQAVREVNRCYGLQIAYTLCYLMLLLIGCPYYFIVGIMNDDINLPENVFTSVVDLSWCIIYVLDLMLIAEPCHLTHVEMETTRVLISHLYHCTRSIHDHNLGVEVNQFIKYLAHSKVTYNPLNVAIMSRSLVVTILSSITANIIIILQLDKSNAN